jgi:hypothetical protein
MYWTGIAINGVFPAMEAVFGVWLYTLADKGLETPNSLEVAFSVSIVGVCLVQVVSGVILIKSVLSIRKYLLAGAPERVNIKTLIVQSASFGLFLVSISFYAVIYVIYILND